MELIGSVFDGRVTQFAPQSWEYQTRLLPTATWLTAALAIVAGEE